MSCAIKIQEGLFEFINSTILNVCQTKNIPVQILYHSNLISDIKKDILRVYISRQIFREKQDTLCVDVTDKGQVRYTSDGVCSISFFQPKTISDGYRVMEELAQELKNALRKKRFANLWVRNPTATPYNIEQNCYRYNVTFNYEFDEIV